MNPDLQREYNSFLDNTARLMVRRHLRPLLDAGAKEEDLILRYKSLAHQFPDDTMRQLTRRLYDQYVTDQQIRLS